jgi:predicted protein tyrosine phosphatase
LFFSDFKDIAALSAGTNPDAETPISDDLIEWADIIFAMEAAHFRRLKQRFGKLLNKKKVVVLGITDEYSYMDPELVKLLRNKVIPFLHDPAINPESS